MPVTRFLEYLTPDLLSLGTDLIRWLYQHWTATGFMYRVQDCEVNLTILDTKGKKAVYRKHQQVKFLQDTIAYQDQAWGEGNIFADYKCSPGIPVDRYQDGNRWRVLISLRENKNRGQEEEFHVERTIEDGFTDASGYFQIKVDHPTAHLSISVTFPNKRPPRRVILVEQNRNRTRILGAEHIHKLPSGQFRVEWETIRPRLFEMYTLRWEW
ncbi:MAG: hypothetical protein H6673_15765 [Anaerolineales bacterium]|nr:hypothetical protein [Anaerolineales bacterium]